MSSDIDLDDLLDEVLNECVPQRGNDVLDSPDGVLFPASSNQQQQIQLKYPALASLDPVTCDEWTKVIEVDEARMKLKHTKPLSNAYCGHKGTAEEGSLREVLSSLLKEVNLTSADIDLICSDERLLNLFAQELKTRIRRLVSSSDSDVQDARFSSLKRVLVQ